MIDRSSIETFNSQSFIAVMICTFLCLFTDVVFEFSFFFLFGRNSVQKIIFFVLKTKETKARRSAFTKRVRSYFGFV